MEITFDSFYQKKFAADNQLKTDTDEGNPTV